jgi:hypothetical protein
VAGGAAVEGDGQAALGRLLAETVGGVAAGERQGRGGSSNGLALLVVDEVGPGLDGVRSRRPGASASALGWPSRARAASAEVANGRCGRLNVAARVTRGLLRVTGAPAGVAGGRFGHSGASAAVARRTMRSDGRRDGVAEEACGRFGPFATAAGVP